MRRALGIAMALVVAAGPLGAGSAAAQSGNFFKNLFEGGGNGAPTLAGPQAQDPSDVYCPAVEVADGAAVLRSGGADSMSLRHQISFGQLSRECAPGSDGSVRVKVGVQIRALLGPAGAPGRFEAPLTITLKYNEKVLSSRSRRVGVTIPAGAAQGSEAVVEDGFTVPAEAAIGYDIVVSLSGAPAREKHKRTSKARKPATDAPAPSAAADGVSESSPQ